MWRLQFERFVTPAPEPERRTAPQGRLASHLLPQKRAGGAVAATSAAGPSARRGEGWLAKRASALRSAWNLPGQEGTV